MLEALKKKGGIALAFVVVTMVSAGSNVFADPEVKYSSWVQEVRMSGDYRVRHEVFDKRTPGQVDRKRERFRLRLNTDFVLPSKFTIRTTLASGTGEQVSTNQSFDNLGSQKQIWIDKAYVVWQPLSILKLQAGRMANPLWTQYSSDVVWDGDFNPEGFAQNYAQLVGPLNVFVNMMQMVVDEDSGNNQGTAANGSQQDQWLTAGQLGFEAKLPLEARIKLAYAKYIWKNIRFGTLSQAATNEGNRRDGSGVLMNEFHVNEVTGNLGFWIVRLPVSLQGTWVENTEVADSFNPKEDEGYQFGVILGKAGVKNGWELGLFRKSVRTDATVADVSDSDFGDGGTNREGVIGWVAYSPLDWMTVQAKYFDTEVINVALAPGRDDIRRAQFDVVMKF